MRNNSSHRDFRDFFVILCIHKPHVSCHKKMLAQSDEPFRRLLDKKKRQEEE